MLITSIVNMQTLALAWCRIFFCAQRVQVQICSTKEMYHVKLLLSVRVWCLLVRISVFWVLCDNWNVTCYHVSHSAPQLVLQCDGMLAECCQRLLHFSSGQLQIFNRGDMGAQKFTFALKSP